MTLAAVVLAAVAARPPRRRGAAPARPSGRRSRSRHPWNRFLLGVQATPGDQPATVHPTYELAILHAAIHDAVVTIDHSGRRT